jgi:hypothetical protein
MDRPYKIPPFDWKQVRAYLGLPEEEEPEEGAEDG